MFFAKLVHPPTPSADLHFPCQFQHASRGLLLYLDVQPVPPWHLKPTLNRRSLICHEHLTWKNAEVDEQMKTSISSFSIGKILIGTQTLQDLEMPMDKYQIANLDGAWVVSQNNVVTLCRNSRFYAPSLVTGTNCLRTVWQLLINNFGRIVRVNGGNWSFSGSMWQ